MKILIILAISFGLFSCVSTKRTTINNRFPAQYELVTLKTENLSFDSFTKTLKESNAKNIEEALFAISSKYPNYLKFHTLMYDSFSLHESSFLEPRAIVFGPRAEFILTFNGGTHLRGGNALEVMQFNQQSGEFQFREIAFNTTLNSESMDSLTEADIEYQNSYFKISKANPNKCTACHGQTAHPIWENYFLWPGAYGGNDDILTGLFHQKDFEQNGNYKLILSNGIKPGASLGRLVQLKKGFKDIESVAFSKFIARKSSHPRFKHLPNRGIDSAFERINSGENPNSINSSQVIENEFKEMGLSDTSSHLHSRPNFALNELLNKLSIKSFVTKSLSDPKTSQIPFKLAWIYFCSSSSNGNQINNLNEQSNFKIELRDPFNESKLVLTRLEIETIKSTSGPWKEFFRKFVSDELDMEAEKIKRFERGFGPNSIEVSKDYLGNPPQGRDTAYYKKIKGRTLNHFEKIAAFDEIENLHFEALVAYVSKGLGMDLKKFAINLRRVPTFRSGGLNYLLEELKERNLISDTGSNNSFAAYLSETCPEILSHAINK